MEFPIYLDHNATTPCDPRVVEAMIPYFTKSFGNPSSRYHSLGWQAEEAVELAREQIARLIGAKPNEIFFTSGATESVNLALKGVFESEKNSRSHFISSGAEHKAVLDSLQHIQNLGGSYSYLPMDSNGIIQAQSIKNNFNSQTLMVSLMMVNNETGVIQDLKEMANLIKSETCYFFSDATQAIGKIPVNVNDLGIDLMAFTAHKIYGPMGIGALFVRSEPKTIPLVAQIDGGGQERGIRNGTLNVPGIVGFGKACEIAQSEMVGDALRLGKLRDKLENELLKIEGARLNGSKTHRISHTTNISFKNRDIEKWIMKFNKYLAVSTGSACNSANLEPSHVLLEMGVSKDLALNSLRFGLGRFTTEEEIDFALEVLNKD